MKKFIAIALAVLTVLSFSTVAFAADTTTLTTTVPDATYTLNIPADQEIAFGKTSTDIGSITVTESSGFASGKDLKVTLTYDDFKCEGVSTTIPFNVCLQDSTYDYSGPLSYEQEINVLSGGSIVFKGNSTGSVNQKVSLSYSAPNGNYTIYMDDTLVEIDSTDWGKALGGEYTSTITFTAEVVSES